MENRFFSLSLPLNDSEFLTTVRLAVGGLCSVAGMDMDSSEDFKVCITESLLLLKRNGFRSATVDFNFSNGFSASLIGKELSGEKGDSLEDEISFALLGALVQDTQFHKNENGVIEKIELRV